MALVGGDYLGEESGGVVLVGVKPPTIQYFRATFMSHDLLPFREGTCPLSPKKIVSTSHLAYF